MLVVTKEIQYKVHKKLSRTLMLGLSEMSMGHHMNLSVGQFDGDV